MPSIAFISPAPMEGSGGLKRIFNYAYELILAGYACDVYIIGTSKNASIITEEIKRHYGIEGVNIYDHINITKSYDIAVATMWTTAKLVRDMDAQKKAYLVQDFEAWFNPLGDGFLLAEESYMYGLKTFTYGRWLSNKLHRSFGNTPAYTDFCTNHVVFYEYRAMKERLKRKRKVSFIYQSDKPRRCPIIGLEALRLVKHYRPDIDVNLIGSPVAPEVGFEFNNLGILTSEGLNKVYNDSVVGFCISSSNPSCNAFDMMAAGLPSVELYRENNLFDMPNEGVLLAHQSSESLASAIISLLDDEEKLVSMSNFGKSFMSSRGAKTEIDDFVNFIDTLWAEGVQSFSLNKETYHGKPKIAAVDVNESILKIYDIQTLESKQASVLDNLYIKQSRVEPFVFDVGSCNSSSNKVLTIDVWDTLIRRNCHPDDIKFATARFMLSTMFNSISPEYRETDLIVRIRQSKEKEIGAESLKDDEYCLSDVLRRSLEEVFINPEKVTDSQVKKVYDYEINQEIYVTEADPDIRCEIAKVEYDEIKFLSDFYIDQNQLLDLLNANGYKDLLSGGLSSCDVKLNKRSGNLFKYLQKTKGYLPSNWTHIGDNQHSDVDIPNGIGIKGIMFTGSVAQQEKIKLFEGLIASRSNVLKTVYEVKNLTLSVPSSDKISLYGVDKAPLFVGFVLSVMEDAIQQKLERVFFCTREGVFFKAIYDELKKHNPFGVEAPESVLLEVSRIATFGPSLSEFSLDALMRVWSMYSTQSLKTLFLTIDVPLGLVSSYFDKYDIDANREIQYPWLDEKVIALFSNTEFITVVEKELADKRSKLFKYCAGQGLYKDTKKIGLVDIGWRGTIQDNLCYLFPNTEIHGRFLGLNSFLNAQPENGFKSAFGPDTNISTQCDKLLDAVAPIEMLCNSDTGSVLRYQHVVDDKYEAQKLSDKHEDMVYFNFTQNFQQSVLKSVPLISEIVKSHGLVSADIREYCLELWVEIIFNPLDEMVDAYFGLNHNDTFGAGLFTLASTHINYSKFFHLLITRDNAGLEIFINSAGWPKGLLSKAKLNRIWEVYLKLGEYKRSKMD